MVFLRLGSENEELTPKTTHNNQRITEFSAVFDHAIPIVKSLADVKDRDQIIVFGNANSIEPSFFKDIDGEKTELYFVLDCI